MEILVIDDDKDTLALTRRATERCGYETLGVSDSREAIKTIAKSGIRIVISDWVMPELSGLDLVRALRADPLLPYVYFIVLTGTRLGHINFMEAMDAGADDYLSKPLDRELLRVRLRVANRILKLDTEINDLKNLIPVCAGCRKVRRDDQAYESIEAYLARHSAIRFSHGLCPDCAKKLYPEYT
ncbi:MAG: response regulator [Elusimicrobiales bacterium]|nr:response regulator [Elusimicrobiales bacterium]